MQTIHLHRHAPQKVPAGSPCNGCGVCCASEPCPLGMLLSRHTRGRCVALAWDEAGSRYVCNAVAAPESLMPAGLQPGAPLLARLARRWISAGSGCDASLEASPPGADAGGDASGG